MGFWRAVSRTYLFLGRWKLTGHYPGNAKSVVVCAPHTTAWDLPVLLAVACVEGVQLRYLGKKELLEGVLGCLFAKSGCVGVDRSKSSNLVTQVAAAFANEEQLLLAVAPEGTRKGPTHWRSGFLHIARGAGVVVVPAYANHKTRVAGFGPSYTADRPTRAVMDDLRAFFGEAFKENPLSNVRLKDEET
jgi:1-acyl-sn-glycerol-3-phosphate acyltransferase